MLCGVDEVGRGSLAGPVCAAAVILKPDWRHKDLKDSKKLSEAKRLAMFSEIVKNSVTYGVGCISSGKIDKLNIHQATLKAMGNAVDLLNKNPSQVVVDGIHCPNIGFPCEAVIKGDSIIPEIAAASIIAKVTRDAYMVALHEKFPVYGFYGNKGYPTRYHIDALSKYGPCREHRRSYGPIRRLLPIR